MIQCVNYIAELGMRKIEFGRAQKSNINSYEKVQNYSFSSFSFCLGTVTDSDSASLEVNRYLLVRS